MMYSIGETFAEDEKKIKREKKLE